MAPRVTHFAVRSYTPDRGYEYWPLCENADEDDDCSDYEHDVTCEVCLAGMEYD